LIDGSNWQLSVQKLNLYGCAEWVSSQGGVWSQPMMMTPSSPKKRCEVTWWKVDEQRWTRWKFIAP